MKELVNSLLYGICQSSYYINLLSLKLPLGLTVRASRAKYVLAGILLVYVPFLIFTHVVLLSKLQEASIGLLVWHLLTAIWITIPLLVVGAVILSSIRTRELCMAFIVALLGAACLHAFVLPVVQPMRLGTILLQVMFAFFEDAPTAGWIWCLVHAVRLQNHFRKQQQGDKALPISPRGPTDTVLVMGNAPTVVEGEPFGPVIDTFSEVVRFNSYSTDKQEYTGSRVTYHCSNGRELPSQNTVKAVLPLFNASLTHACYLFMPHMTDAREICERLMNSKVDAWLVNEELILALCKKIHCNFWQIPSSGMVAIESFMQKYSQVSLHGFTFFAGKRIHYFDEKPLQLITSWLERYVTHNPPCEKRWVQKLVKEGRVCFLSPPDSDSTDEQNGESTMSSDHADEKKSGKNEARRRMPQWKRMLTMDGIPSQFSL